MTSTTQGSQGFEAFGEIERVPLSKIQAITAAHLSHNWSAIPHVTHHDFADLTDFEIVHSTTASVLKITPVVLMVKLVAMALRAFPQFNSSLDSDGHHLTLKRYINIGVATDTPRGLMVPVIRDVLSKSLEDLSRELRELTARAREKGLPAAALSGGCMTITSLGHIGGAAFTPIINSPEVAILGLSRIQEVAQRNKTDSLTWRRLLPLSLSYDHRVINGADAARFCRFLAEQVPRVDGSGPGADS